MNKKVSKQGMDMFGDIQLLPPSVILDHLCGSDVACRGVRKRLMIEACRNHTLKFKPMTADANLVFSIEQQVEGDLILITKRSFEEWSEAQFRQSKNHSEESMNPRREKTFLFLTYAFLELTVGRFKNQSFATEEELRGFIEEKFDDLKGLSARNTAGIFAEAKRVVDHE